MSDNKGGFAAEPKLDKVWHLAIIYRGWGVATRTSGPISRQDRGTLSAGRTCQGTTGETTTTLVAVGVSPFCFPHG